MDQRELREHSLSGQKYSTARYLTMFYLAMSFVLDKILDNHHTVEYNVHDLF